jgi:hypothetical protein
MAQIVAKRRGWWTSGHDDSLHQDPVKWVEAAERHDYRPRLAFPLAGLASEKRVMLCLPR